MGLVQRLLLAPVPVVLQSPLTVDAARAVLMAAFAPQNWALPTRWSLTLFPASTNVGEVDGNSVRLRIVHFGRRGMRPELCGVLRATGSGCELVGVVRYALWRRLLHALVLCAFMAWCAVVVSEIVAPWPTRLMASLALPAVVHLSTVLSGPSERKRIEQEVTRSLARNGTGCHPPQLPLAQ